MSVVRHPAAAFARGAIVRHRNSANHMLVVRSYPDLTACVLVESTQSGDLRLRDFVTADLTLELDAAIPLTKEANHVET